MLTIVLSWTFIHVIFAFHYAHEFYGEGRDQHVGGLEFPDDDQPNYWDFIYFSFVIGMTFQVSDVQVTSKLIQSLPYTETSIRRHELSEKLRILMRLAFNVEHCADEGWEF